MTVYETDLPGVGKKFELELGDETRVVVVIHHGGRREIFLGAGADADLEKLFVLSDRAARQLGSILQGTYFQPIASEAVSTMLGPDTFLDWVEISPGSPLAQGSLGEIDLRRHTGATVLAVKRGEETLTNPGPDLELVPGDVLVVLGSREEVDAAEALALGDA